jgi:hypothetical protein
VQALADTVCLLVGGECTTTLGCAVKDDAPGQTLLGFVVLKQLLALSGGKAVHEKPFLLLPKCMRKGSRFHLKFHSKLIAT